ncbi:hypothetical protein WJX79_008111 [Trebouxia sp. C0005]
MGLYVTAQTALPVYASPTNVRVQSEHTVSVRRALLEDLLMKEMGTRLKSMSDDDLMLVLEQEAKAAAGALPDAWQQQTFRLQAFTRPLMQRLQGSASTPQASKPALEAQQPEARAAQASPSSSLLSGQQPLSSQEPGTSQQEQQGGTDEAEDAITRMLQSAGVALPSSASSPNTSAGGSAAQPAQVGSRSDPMVASYLGAIWRRTLPQLLFLASVTTFSTLVVNGPAMGISQF